MTELARTVLALVIVAIGGVWLLFTERKSQ